MDLEEQIDTLEAKYNDWEDGVRQDLGEAEGEAALDAGAWVDGARQIVQFAGPGISLRAKNEFLRTKGLGPVKVRH